MIVNYAADHSLDAAAIAFGRKAQDTLRKGSDTGIQQTYLNYAFGTESLESIYGYEPWRLARLRALKAKYDPQRRFNFYNPFTTN